MRIAATVAVVLLLILGGFWISGQGGQDEAPPPSDAETVEPTTESVAPDGTTEVTLLSDERRISFQNAEPVLEPGRDYLAVIDTNKGPIVIDLYQDLAPQTVNNFVFLALNRYYDGIVFHRVLEDFMAQTGDPTGTGRGGPGYQFPDEFAEGLAHDQPGILSMANAGPGTNGSQFFITFVATPWLDGRHAIFANVIEGLDILPTLTRIDPSNPSALALLSDPVSSIVDQGIALQGPGEQLLEQRLTEALGAPPVDGQSFTLDGFQGVIGRVGGDQAVGFFPEPDFIERVTIYTRDE